MNQQERLALIQALNKALATIHECMKREQLAKRGFRPFSYILINDKKDLLRFLGEE